jgi:hypothetical protein
MTDEQQNLAALYDFFHRNKQYGNVIENGDLVVDRTHISYICKNRQIYLKGYSRVVFNILGYNAGKVSIDESGSFSIDILHLDLYTKFQEFVYNEKDNTLIIKGTSTKMGGSYCVTLKI